MTAGDRFRLVLDDSGGVLMLDRRGRVREWGSWRAAVRALTDAGEDLAAWRLYWLPAGAIGWRAACLACDAGDVFGACPGVGGVMTAVRLCSAVLLVPNMADPDGDEIVAGEIDGVTRADVSAWAAGIMASRTGGRVFVTEWEPGPYGDRLDTGVTGERLPDDSAVRWFGA